MRGAQDQAVTHVIGSTIAQASDVRSVERDRHVADGAGRAVLPKALELEDRLSWALWSDSTEAPLAARCEGERRVNVLDVLPVGYRGRDGLFAETEQERR